MESRQARKLKQEKFSVFIVFVQENFFFPDYPG
jgi:hypothetical protein